MSKYMRLNVQVDDDFEPGQCYNCPLSYEEEYDYDGYMEYETMCAAHCYYENCPLIEIDTGGL